MPPSWADAIKANLFDQQFLCHAAAGGGGAWLWVILSLAIIVSTLC